MSSVSLKWDGLVELRAALRKLPTELAAEASQIVLDAGNQTVDIVGAVYESHDKTGNLRRGLTMRPSASGPYGAGVLVKSAAKHAWLFDHGSRLRSYTTKTGKKHSTGAMWSKTPPPHIFAGTMSRKRRAMWPKFRELLERHGLEVSGDVR